MGPRVQCIYGTEGGTAKRGIDNLAKILTAKSGGKYSVEKPAEGNAYGTDEAFAGLAQSCDVLIIATSSYGEGDPPANYNRFLLNLTKAAKAGTKPLKGLQHAVLGYGESVYETFQVTRGPCHSPFITTASHARHLCRAASPELSTVD